MRGEFSGVRQEIIDELVSSFNWHEAVDSTFFHSLFRDTIPSPKAPRAPEPTDLNDDGEIYLPGDLERFAAYKRYLEDFEDRKAAFNDATSDEAAAWEYFQDYILDGKTTEVELVRVVERAFDVFEEFGGDDLANDYFNTVSRFLERYSLRYDLRRPLSLHPTLPGIFAKLIRDLKVISARDANMADRLQDFEEALRDLKIDYSSRRIRVCVQAQMNLLEAVACRHPQAEGQATLGEMCKSLDTWPHKAVSGSLSSLYGFSSDFSGVRHGKASKGVKREIDMRDLVSMSVILAGFVPYLTEELDSESIYAG
ncbi:hypothetical protein [Celeribacter sp.]|uniref:hypothetical protein n=1 Tax=Celeribacter sp. TaxID=1890673 RepID=UPI003A908239